MLFDTILRLRLIASLDTDSDMSRTGLSAGVLSGKARMRNRQARSIICVAAHAAADTYMICLNGTCGSFGGKSMIGRKATGRLLSCIVRDVEILFHLSSSSGCSVEVRKGSRTSQSKLWVWARSTTT